MRSLVSVVCCLALAAASPLVPDTRASCPDSFANVPNPCSPGVATGRTFFPHPTDANKFLMCDTFGRMFIVQCPAGEFFNTERSSCTLRVVATTSAPAVSVIPGQPVVEGTNPCTPENLAAGKTYFALAGDNKRFIECDLQGHANILTCPSELVWAEARLSCVYPFEALKPGSVTTGANTGLNGITNPCNANAISAGSLFYPHPDPSKFLQCDLWGDVFVNNCPTGLIWNDYSKTCAGAFINAAGR